MVKVLVNVHAPCPSVVPKQEKGEGEKKEEKKREKRKAKKAQEKKKKATKRRVLAGNSFDPVKKINPWINYQATDPLYSVSF